MELDRNFFAMEEIEIPELSSDDYCDNKVFLEFMNRWQHLLVPGVQSPLDEILIRDHNYEALEWLKQHKNDDEWRTGAE